MSVLSSQTLEAVLPHQTCAKGESKQVTALRGRLGCMPPPLPPQCGYGRAALGRAPSAQPLCPQPIAEPHLHARGPGHSLG